MQKRHIAKKGINSIIAIILLILVGLVALAALALIFQSRLFPTFEKKLDEGFSSVGEQKALAGEANQAPQVNAGADQAIPFSDDISANLQGSASDSDGPNPLTYNWEKVSGPGDVIFIFGSTITSNNAGSSDPVILNNPITFTAPGTYILLLRVSDGALSSEDRVIFDVGESFSESIPPSEDLLLHYSFEGSFNDISGNENTLNYVGPIALESPITLEKMLFRESLQNTYAVFKGWGLSYLNRNSISNFDPSSFTISLWIKHNSSNLRISVPFSLYDGAVLLYIQDSELYLNLSTKNGILSEKRVYTKKIGPVFDNDWHHVALTFEGNSASSLFTYFDGKRVDAVLKEESAILSEGNSLLVLGANLRPYSIMSNLYKRPIHFYNGAIDEVKIFKRALSTQEINSLYNKPPKVNAGIDAAFTLNEQGFVEVDMNGDVSDDGKLRILGGFDIKWELMEGPAGVDYTGDNEPQTGIAFYAPGIYFFKLSASDGFFTVSDDVFIVIKSPFSEDLLPAPSDVNLTVNGTTINISWKYQSPSSIMTKVYRARFSKGPWTLVTLLPFGYLSYTDRNLLQSTQYFYTLFVFNATGVSAGSNITNATTKSLFSFSNKSLDLEVQQISPSEIIATWEENTSEGGNP